MLVPPRPLRSKPSWWHTSPSFICLACLSQVTARAPADVKTVVEALLATRRASGEPGALIPSGHKSEVNGGVLGRDPAFKDYAAGARHGEAVAIRCYAAGHENVHVHDGD